jgi:hypothetical protein
MSLSNPKPITLGVLVGLCAFTVFLLVKRHNADPVQPEDGAMRLFGWVYSEGGDDAGESVRYYKPRLFILRDDHTGVLLEENFFIGEHFIYETILSPDGLTKRIGELEPGSDTLSARTVATKLRAAAQMDSISEARQRRREIGTILSGALADPKISADWKQYLGERSGGFRRMVEEIDAALPADGKPDLGRLEGLDSICSLPLTWQEDEDGRLIVKIQTSEFYEGTTLNEEVQLTAAGRDTYSHASQMALGEVARLHPGQ